MKATIEVPDELYRRVKAKSALEGRAVREVAEELFRRYVGQDELDQARAEGRGAARRLLDGEPLPSWFGALSRVAHRGKRHDMSAIRASIAAGIAKAGARLPDVVQLGSPRA